MANKNGPSHLNRVPRPAAWVLHLHRHTGGESRLAVVFFHREFQGQRPVVVLSRSQERTRLALCRRSHSRCSPFAGRAAGRCWLRRPWMQPPSQRAAVGIRASLPATSIFMTTPMDLIRSEWMQRAAMGAALVGAGGLHQFALPCPNNKKDRFAKWPR